MRRIAFVLPRVLIRVSHQRNPNVIVFTKWGLKHQIAFYVSWRLTWHLHVPCVLRWDRCHDVTPKKYWTWTLTKRTFFKLESGGIQFTNSCFRIWKLLKSTDAGVPCSGWCFLLDMSEFDSSSSNWSGKSITSVGRWKTILGDIFIIVTS